MTGQQQDLSINLEQTPPSGSALCQTQHGVSGANLESIPEILDKDRSGDTFLSGTIQETLNTGEDSRSSYN